MHVYQKNDKDGTHNEITTTSDCTVHTHFECEYDNVHYSNSNNFTLFKKKTQRLRKRKWHKCSVPYRLYNVFKDFILMRVLFQRSAN